MIATKKASAPMMTKFYVCPTCGKILRVKQLVKNGTEHCPNCGAFLSKKEIMKRYRRDEGARISINCMCGAEYSIPRPRGDWIFECQRCGRYLISVRKDKLNLDGIAVPRFPDIGEEGGEDEKSA